MNEIIERNEIAESNQVERQQYLLGKCEVYAGTINIPYEIIPKFTQYWWATYRFSPPHWDEEICIDSENLDPSIYDLKNLRKIHSQGWKFVPASRHPELLNYDGTILTEFKGCIIARELILCEIAIYNPDAQKAIISESPLFTKKLEELILLD